jgi:ubiquinone/menaquinone biosynthesis C-methylase UbiE
MNPENTSAESTFDAFNRDVAENSGYIYTTNAQLSSRMANRRLSDATLALARWKGKKVVDIGCGDGTYSLELLQRGKIGQLWGADPADQAIEIAQQKAGKQTAIFGAYDAYALPYEDDQFDIAHLRGVLHHVERPQDVLREAFRVAPTVVVIEPNGYNPGLKILEKCSSYHVEHDEKSYAPAAIDRWIHELGGRVEMRRWVGLVPFFCPDAIACSLKYFEPLVELTPGLNQVGCAVYTFRATRPATLKLKS